MIPLRIFIKCKKIYTEGSYNDIHHVDDIATSPKFAKLEDQLGDNKGAIFLIAILLKYHYSL